MDFQEAFTFLRVHRSVPEDASGSILNEWHRVIQYFYYHPNKACIPLLIGAFGENDHFDVFVAIQSVLRKFDQEEVIPHLNAGLMHEDRAIRQWSADTVRFFPWPGFIPALKRMLREDDPLSRYESAVALERIKGGVVREIANHALPYEADDDVRLVLESIVAHAS